MKKALLFDVETTGLNHKLDQIIEFGGILLDENMNVIEEISTFVKCDDPLPAKIIEITNITDDMLLDGINEEELANKLNQLVDEETVLIAYNVQFDIGFFISLLERFNLKFKNNMVIDCMVVYKDRHPYPHRLLNDIEKYKLAGVNSHRALDDALATLELYKKMDAEDAIRPFYENRISYHSKYGLNGYKLPYVTYFPYVYKNHY